MTKVEQFKKLNIVSIDPSLRSTGIYYSKYGKTDTLVGVGERYEVLANQMQTWLATFCTDVDLVLVEDYAFSRNSRSVTALAEVGGIIRATATFHRVPVIEVPSSFWKKRSGFGESRKKNTKAEKQSYVEYGKSIYNLPYLNPDEVDATMIYLGCKNALYQYENGIDFKDKRKVPQCLCDLLIFLQN